jgi:hypothetical protein
LSIGKKEPYQCRGDLPCWSRVIFWGKKCREGCREGTASVKQEFGPNRSKEKPLRALRSDNSVLAIGFYALRSR